MAPKRTLLDFGFEGLPTEPRERKETASTTSESVAAPKRKTKSAGKPKSKGRKRK
jgi:hypothetical protein